MRKYVITCSFWLGTMCAALAVLARGLDILGINTLNFSTKGSEIGYHTFMDGSFLFYIVSIATATYAGFNSQSRSFTMGEEYGTKVNDFEDVESPEESLVKED